MVKNKPDLIPSPDEVAFTIKNLEELFAKKAIVPCEHEEGDFVSSIFLILKKNSSSKWRLILNLKEFNHFAEKSSFKMETLKTILTMVTPSIYQTNTDLLDAFLMLPMSPAASSYLKVHIQRQITQIHSFTIWIYQKSKNCCQDFETPSCCIMQQSLTCVILFR